MTNSPNKDLLIQHALKNIVCTIDNKKSITVKPSRITNAQGVKSSFSFMWNTCALPVNDKLFHVYQIGRSCTNILNIDIKDTDKWISSVDAQLKYKALIDVFTDSGLNISRHFIYFRISRDNNVIMVIEKNKYTDCVLDNDVYVRVYKNKLYNNADEPLKFGHQIITRKTPVNTTQLKILEMTEGIGYFTGGDVICFKNGFYISRVNPITVSDGDCVDWYMDASFIRHIEYPLEHCRQYVSNQNSKEYLILMHALAIDHVEHIEHVDFYLVKRLPHVTVGLHLQSKCGEVTKMLTHRDYAVLKEAVEDRKNRINESYPEEGEFFITAYFREQNCNKPLVAEKTRLKELYKFNYLARLDIISGKNGPDYWHAENLENSDYLKLLDANAEDVTKEKVFNALGYGATAKLLGGESSLVKTVMKDSYLVAKVPEGMIGNCTAYEYGVNNELVSVAIADTAEYRCSDFDVVFVEFIPGIAGNILDLTMSTNSGSLSPQNNYRFYQIERDKWTDISDTSKVKNDLGHWSIDAEAGQCAALSNKRHLFIEQNIPLEGSAYCEVLIGYVKDGKTLPIPFNLGQYSVFINKHTAIEGIDYIIDFPKIRIISDSFFITAEPYQNIIVRGVGFCKPDMTYYENDHIGFVKSKMFNKNAKYLFRENARLEITWMGERYDQSNLIVSDTTSNVIVGNRENGYPYSVRRSTHPLPNYLTGKQNAIDTTYSDFTECLEFDNKLTMHLKEIDFVQESEIANNKYLVTNQYSPFLSQIIKDMESGYFWTIDVETGIDDDELEYMLKHYKPLLKGDPITVKDHDTIKFTFVRPVLNNQPVYLTMDEISVLDRIVSKYANGRISLDGYIKVKD